MLICIKKENDPKVKERLLLVIRVKEDGQIPFHVVKGIHRSNLWDLDWLKRYDVESINGLKTRPKSGRPTEISEDWFWHKELLSTSRQGWTTKPVDDLIIKKSGIKYHYIHIYLIPHK